MEFLASIADLQAPSGNKVGFPPALFQPIAADDVASAVARDRAGPPRNGIVEIAGPEQCRLDEIVRRGLNPHARIRARLSLTRSPATTGVELSEGTLVPGDDARLGETRFETWLS